MADIRWDWEHGHDAEYGPDRLWSSIATVVAAKGDQVAAVCGDRILTYAELAGRSAALAGRLRTAGAGPERPVAVFADDGLDALVACLAVFRSGGVYLPVDPRWPIGRQAAVCADARPVAAVATGGTLPFDLPVLPVDAGVSQSEIWPQPAPELAAYLMYTSGSTGRPKGVLVTHGALANRMLWWQEAYPLRPDDVLLATASPGFDISVWELLAGLLAGARLVIAEHRVHGIVPYLPELMRDQRVTVAHFVPSVLDELLSGLAGEERLGLRLAVCGGETVPPSLRDRLLARSDTLLVHAYGPTETTITVLHDECRRGAENMPLGRPMHNVTAAIVDEQGRRVPVGVAGELVLGGVPLARGYLGRAAETATRFVPDWLGLAPSGGSRLYRTGDRACWLPDGRILFLGRTDDQFKVRGHRVDPAEVESLLHQHPAVDRAVVRLVDGARVTAYVQGTAPAGVLRAYLAEHLAEPVIPTGWVVVDRFPLTPNGKIDYAALPDVPARTGATVAALGSPADAATSELERELGALWADLLGTDTVGALDDFFALGGHSLVATRIVAAVWQRHRVRLSMADVMLSRTVRVLARRIEELAGCPVEPPAEPEPGQVVTSEAPAELPLSHAQARILFEEEFLGGPGLFSVPVLTRWHGAVDTSALRVALDGLVRRHPVLRGALAGDAGPARLLVRNAAAVPFTLEDLRVLPPEAGEARVADAAVEMLAEPFDLHQPPLVRARLLRLADEHHVFLLVLHHLVCDRWSMRVLVHDLRALYQAAFAGRQPRLAPPSSPLSTVPPPGERARDLDYWVRQLDGVPLDVDLAVGRRHREDHGHRAGRVLRLLSQEQATALSGLCGARGVTPFMVLLTVFQVLLHRFSAADDVVVGAPVADRDRPDANAVVSMLVNTVPLRADLRGDPRFVELLERNRAAVLAAHQHQAVPIERLASALGRRRDAGHHPLMRYLMVWEDSAGIPVELPGVIATPMRPPSYTTAFDLTLIARALPGGVDLELEFNEDVLDSSAAEILADAFTALIADFLADPDLRIGAARLAHIAPRSGLVGPVEPPAPGVLGLVRAAAGRHPDAVAVLDGAAVVSYAELLRHADVVAHRIRAAGGGPGAVVGVCLPRSATLVAALLGVLSAGGAFLPLSPDDPDVRVARQIRISGARWVITADGERFARLGVPAISPDIGETIEPQPQPQAQPEPDPDSTAYVIFTSGSTGEPKGVMVAHRALADHVRWAMREYELTPADRVLQFSSVTFDVLLEEVFPTLAVGASVVLRDASAASSAAALLRQCQGSKVTVLNLPTGYWERLTLALAEDGLTWPRSVRLMVIGGQQADPAAVRRWHRHAPGVRLLNAYGPTEATIGATVAELTPGDAVPIGVPIPNTRAYLLDRYLAPVPDGTVAQLYLAGTGLADGYVNRPRLTAERFLPDPFAGDGQRMYRTGDLAYRRAGTLYFVGRADRQVKVRGYRIELDEVERALVTHPLVDEAAVVVRGDRLEAHVAATGVDASTVRAHLAARLPAFMVPSVIAVVPRLPKTANGKVDRAVLAPVATEPDTGFQPPRNDRERAVCALWAEVLGVARVGVRDSFFDLGGHSLLAMDLVRRMRRQGYPGLRVADLFEHPTIEGLSPWASDEPGTTSAAPVGPALDSAPLSWAQLGFWAQAATVGDATFHLPVVLRLSGPLDEGLLRSAIAGLVARHDLLRCVLVDGADNPLWRLADSVHPLRVLNVPEEDLDERVRELIAEPFDLRAAPPVRWSLLRLPGDESVLVIVLHHIASDGWSAQLLVRELAELYAARAEHRPARLDPAPSFLTLAAADRAAAPDEAGLAFWAETLRGAPERMDLPTDRPPTDQPSRPAHAAGRHSARRPLPRQTVAALTDLARAERATVFMTLLAAVSAWLARCCRETDVTVGTAVADRDGFAAGAVGPLINVLPIRTAVDLTGSFTAHLARTRSAVLAAFEHRSVPTQRIVQHLGRSGSGLVQVVFDLDEAARAETIRFGPVTASTVPLTPRLGAFDLEITALPTPDGLDIELRGAADRFTPDGVGHLATALVHLLTGVATRPDDPLAIIELLDEQERHRLLVEPNQRTLPGRPAEVVSLVARWVAGTPDAPAVVASSGALTYRELDALSDGVAGWLRDQGLPPEAAVATRLGRCLELPAVVLGIWKAGGVYVPLDPAHPDARHRQILADCRPYALISDEPEDGPIPTLAVTAIRPAATPDRRPAATPDRRPAPDQLAYLAYTSGSTGTPKGVQCTQRGLANQLLWSRQAYPLRPGEAVAQVAAVGFDISLWEMFHPLANGGRVVVLDQGRHGDVAAIADLVAQQRVAVLHLVPTLLELYLEHVAQRPTDSLRHVLCGGERPAPGLPERFTARLSAALHHTYGPTEASIIATHWRCPADRAPGRMPLGAPLPNARLYLLDPYDQPVPVGVIGEVVLGGEVLARGYLNQPAATAARFVPDPFTQVPGARMYRTGDLARYRPDGGLEFVGRADRQVKIAGVRVEPHEIEAAITADPRVAASAVLLRRDEAGVAMLVGYVVPADPAGDPDRLCAEVRQTLRQRLPRAMVPAYLVPLAKLPVGVNGKLDEAALPEPVASVAPEGSTTCGTDAERRLAAIWAQVLPGAAGRAIGPTDNFFDLGGDSVSAIRVVGRARAAGLQVELGQVLRAETLAELAAAAVPVEPTTTEFPAGQSTGAGTADHRLWLTPAQRRFLATAGRRLGHFNQAVLVEPTQRVTEASLLAALRAVADHHAAFRLRAVWDGDRWADHAVLASPQDTLAMVAVADRPLDARSIAALARPVHEALDIENGPLLGALIAERPDGGQVVLLVAHHLAVDTASWETILSHLEISYRQVSQGEPVRLPEPVTSYTEFARALPALAARLDTPEQRAFWRRQLADLPGLPSDRPASDGTDAALVASDTVPVVQELGGLATEALLESARRHRLRIDELLLAALARVVSRWTGDHRVALLRETHGRSGPPGWPDLTGTVGWFTGIHPVRIDLPDAADSVAALRATREALAAVPDGGLGYGMSSVGDLPEPDLVVNYLGAAAKDTDPGLFARAERQMLGEYAAVEHATVAGIELIAGIDGRGLWMEWLSSPDRFASMTIRWLSEELRTELIGMASMLERPFGVAAVPADFPEAGLPADQLRAVLAAYPGTRAVLPLSPAQQGMLAWHLAHPESAAYHTQILFALDGDVDEATLREAWQDVVAHTDVFRSGFVSAALDQPVQVIGASPPVDWRRHTSEEAALAADRAEPFDLTKPGPQRWYFVDGSTSRWLLWSHHHILLDGWSLPLVLADVADAYLARTRGRTWAPPNRPSYRAYLSWLSSADERAGERFWHAYLADATATRIGRPGAAGTPAMVTAELSATTTEALARLAGRNRVTLHSVVLAVWSLLLSQRCASRDVTFGVVMSLRPEQIPRAEQVIGLCLNTVPLRVHVDEDGALPVLFGQVQQRLVEVYQHAVHPPGRIRRWAGAPDALFDSIVVFENYPGDRTGQSLGEHGRLRVVRAVESTEFAVCLTVLPGDRLTFELTYQDSALTSAEATGLVRRLARLLERIADRQ